MATKETILVTGANGSLGSAIAAQVASKAELSAYHGLYTVRDAGHAPALNAALAQGSTTHAYGILSLDLTKLDNVRNVAKEINRRVSTGEIPPIRAIVLNAGYQDFGNKSRTEDGLDSVFVANYLGHWLLTLLLLGSMDKEAGRIVVIGSQSHDPNDPRNAATHAFDDPRYKTVISDAAGFNAVARGEWSPAAEDVGFVGGFRRYGASKLFLVMMQHELQQRLTSDPGLSRICVLGVDPGAMPTGIVRLASFFIRVVVFQVILPLMLFLGLGGDMVRAPSRSAGDVLEAAFGAVGEGGELPRDLYFDGRKPFETAEESRDARKRAIVWGESVKLAGLREGDTVLEKWR
ncbi:hypothetical protein DHEL01_v206131 [Diaporthe helianthi]|uniref:3beta-hydroxysteroid 3-dehydrogenase n=1 Tax=Diaporthe helianthi TaxID=158607 RepID=A0A2P5HZ01_DIAHE|nr:hypothetical protein DHEL01_v206131 [Diaporthe helianthi]